MRPDRSNFNLEFLESRVMLSGVDSVVSGVTIADAAIQSSDTLVDVELLPYGQILKIAGSGHGNVTIDLSLLPASVINLQLFSFDSVTLTGSHTVNYLGLTDIHKADAGRITIEVGLTAFNVEQIKIDRTPSLIILNSDGAAGRKTLLEAGSFSAGLVISYLANLGLSSGVSTSEINIFSANPKQNVLLNFQPSRLNVSGVDTPLSQISVVRGDFRSYFLASSTEKASLEQSLLIARQSAVSNLVPLATLLSNPAIRTALGEVVEAGMDLVALRSRTTIAIDVTNTRGENDQSSIPMAAAATAIAALDRTTILQVSTEQLSGRTVAEMSGPQGSAPASGKAAPGAEFAVFTAATALASQPAQAATTQPSGAASMTLANLAEPFLQMVVDLRDRFSTFGDLAVAHVADYLQTESRPVLLVDARSSRERDAGGLTIVKL